MYEVYNQSSATMDQVSDASVDLVVMSPPYNIGTAYGSYTDDIESVAYWTMMAKVFMGCVRVLKPNGRLILQAADTVIMENLPYKSVCVQFAGLLANRLIKVDGLRLETRHYQLVKSEGEQELPEEMFDPKCFFIPSQYSAHSNTHQWLVFRKGPVRRKKGKILYFNSAAEDGHPCPFGADEIAFVLDRYFPERGVVLDPFMGIAKLGTEVVRRSGSFIGYELSPEIYVVAERNLSGIK
ncbi:MAG: DNA methyltransferase [Candidatus Moraniibacteriota bacterium]